MNSKNIRGWAQQSKRKYPVLIYQKTPAGVFSISDVESRVKRSLEPLEWLILKSASSFQKITRVELSIISGIHEEIVQEKIDDLEFQDLLAIVPFDLEKLDSNIQSISEEVGEEWRNNYMEEILSRKFIRQYTITDVGIDALNHNQKTLVIPTNINLVVTGNPYSIFEEEVKLKKDGFEDIPLQPKLIGRILNEARHNPDIEAHPQAVTVHSVANGKEVTNCQFWVAFETKFPKTNELMDCNRQIFLTSLIFERWITPPWNSSLDQELPEHSSLYAMVVSAISETYSMVPDVIEEGLKLLPDGINWEFSSDLEMLLLMDRVDPDLISDYSAEVFLKLPESPWKVVVMLKLVPFEEYDGDLLARNALEAARFHARVSRKGFTLDEGYEIWSRIRQELGQKKGRKEYMQMLDLLKQYKCLNETKKDINLVVIDLDDLLSHNRRNRQPWQFRRIRQLEMVLQHSGIGKVKYVASKRFHQKIDERDNSRKWLKENDVDFYENKEKHYPIDLAIRLQSYFVGNRNIPKSNKYKPLRIYGKQLNFDFDRDLKIPGIEPFFDVRQQNLLEAMYSEYY